MITVVRGFFGEEVGGGTQFFGRGNGVREVGVAYGGRGMGRNGMVAGYGGLKGFKFNNGVCGGDGFKC